MGDIRYNQAQEWIQEENPPGTVVDDYCVFAGTGESNLSVTEKFNQVTTQIGTD